MTLFLLVMPMTVILTTGRNVKELKETLTVQCGSIELDNMRKSCSAWS